MQLNQNVFQIYIQDNDESALPEKIGLAINECKEKSTQYKHHLFGRESLRYVIEKELGNEVAITYDKLAPYAYKADLGRYCLLYLYGGWYFDSTIKLHSKLGLVNADLIIFRDAFNPLMTSWDVSNAVIYGRKNLQVFEIVINKIIENVKSNYYGTSPLCPTGPTLFGKCVASVGEFGGQIAGSLMPLTPSHHIKNYGFVLPDGTILAWGKSSWGTAQSNSLDAYDATGTNSYNEMWHTKRVYNQ